MTVEEFIDKIELDNATSLNEILKYEIVFDETPRYITSELKTKIQTIKIDNKLKQIILK